jgi:hypothetical protein
MEPGVTGHCGLLGHHCSHPMTSSRPDMLTTKSDASERVILVGMGLL